MSRINLIEFSEAEGKTKELLTKVEGVFGRIPNMFKVAAQSSAALEGLLFFNNALGQGELTPQERELIAVAVAEANACSYCLSAHTAIGVGIGLSRAQIEQAREGKGDDQRQKALLTFVKVVVKRGGRVSDEEVAELSKNGFSQGEIIEIIGNVALNIFTNYLNNVAETAIDFPVVKTKVSA